MMRGMKKPHLVRRKGVWYVYKATSDDGEIYLFLCLEYEEISSSTNFDELLGVWGSRCDGDYLRKIGLLS